MLKGKSLAVVVLFLATVSTFATQIIILGTNQAFYVAADSLVAVPGSKPIQECKIHQTGKIIWTAGGLDLDIKTGFSVRDYFKKNGGMGRAEETLDSIAPKIIPALQKELPVLKKGALPISTHELLLAEPFSRFTRLAFLSIALKPLKKTLTSSTAESRNKPATDARLLECVTVI